MAGSNTNIELVTKWSTMDYDKVMKAESCSSVLKSDSDFVRFMGAKTVKIAKMAFGGLSNYNRNNSGDARVPFGGYGNAEDPTGASGSDAPYYGNGYGETTSSVTWEEFTMKMDRAARYVIEKFDNEESGGLLVGKALTEINRTQVVPEVDAYCFSTIYKNAGKVVDDKLKMVNYAGATVDAPLASLNEAFTYLGEHEVPENDQIIFVSFKFLNAMRNSGEYLKKLDQVDFDKNVKFRITQYEGRDLVVVPPARFQTDYVFDPNFVVGQGNGGRRGFAPAEGARDIDYIVMYKKSAIHVTKFEQTKILTGDFALAACNMDAYVIYVRIYHDVFVPDNKKVGIYAHVGWFNAKNTSGTLLSAETTESSFPELAVQLVLEGTKTANKAKVVRNVAFPGDVTYSILHLNTSTSITPGTTTVGGKTAGNVVALSEFNPVGIGDIIDTTKAEAEKLYVVSGSGLVIGKYDKAEGGVLSISGAEVSGD